MIHTRQQLIDWIGKNVQDSVLQIAIQRGTLEILGRFIPLPVSGNEGWLVYAKSPSGSQYLIAIAEHTGHLGKYYWFQAPHVPWDQWLGYIYRNPIDQGDRPELYKELKAAWEGYDPRFTRIVERTSLHPEAYGSSGDVRTGPPVDSIRRDQDVSSAPSRSKTLHDETESGQVHSEACEE